MRQRDLNTSVMDGLVESVFLTWYYVFALGIHVINTLSWKAVEKPHGKAVTKMGSNRIVKDCPSYWGPWDPKKRSAAVRNTQYDATYSHVSIYASNWPMFTLQLIFLYTYL